MCTDLHALTTERRKYHKQINLTDTDIFYLDSGICKKSVEAADAHEMSIMALVDLRVWVC